MDSTQDRVKHAIDIVWAIIRFAPQNLNYVPPFRHFVCRVLRRTLYLSLNGKVSCAAAAEKALHDIQQDDIALVAAAMKQDVGYFAYKFQLDPGDLAHETLLEAIPSVRKRFKPPSNDANNGTLSRGLAKYLKTLVRRTAHELRYRNGRRRIIYDEDVLADVEDKVQMFSEIHVNDEVVELYAKIRRIWPKTYAENSRRLDAIFHANGHLGEAAQKLGISHDALRQWVSQLRERLSK